MTHFAIATLLCHNSVGTEYELIGMMNFPRTSHISDMLILPGLALLTKLINWTYLLITNIIRLPHNFCNLKPTSAVNHCSVDWADEVGILFSLRKISAAPDLALGT